MKNVTVVALSLLSGVLLEAGYNYCCSAAIPVPPVSASEPAAFLPETPSEPAEDLPSALVPLPTETSAAPSSALIAYMPAPRLPAREEIFWLLNYVSARTSRGVIGFPPGQEVRVVGENERTGSLRVSDGNYEVEVFASQLTDEPELAQSIGSYDEAMQAAEQLAQSRAWKRDQAARQQLAVEQADRIQAVSAAATRPPPVAEYAPDYLSLSGYATGGSYYGPGTGPGEEKHACDGDHPYYCNGMRYSEKHRGWVYHSPNSVGESGYDDSNHSSCDNHSHP